METLKQYRSFEELKSTINAERNRATTTNKSHQENFKNFIDALQHHLKSSKREMNTKKTPDAK